MIIAMPIPPDAEPVTVSAHSSRRESEREGYTGHLGESLRGEQVECGSLQTLQKDQLPFGFVESEKDIAEGRERSSQPLHFL
jgi:hypothetical protein